MGAEILAGTTLWSLPPAPGADGTVPKRAQVLRPLWQDLPPEVEQPGLFFIDEGVSEWDPSVWAGTGWYRPFDRPTTLTATTHDGRQLWQRQFGGPVVRQFAADEYGGLVVLLEHYYSPDYEPHFLTRYDGVTGGVSWEYHAPWDHNHASRVSPLAIAADGRVYLVETRPGDERDLIALDGQTGSVVGRWPVVAGPSSGATGPLVQEDGSVVLFTTKRVSDTRELRRVVLGSNPVTLTSTVVDTSALTASQAANLRVEHFQPMPDGHGSVLLRPSRPAHVSAANQSFYREIYRVTPADVLSAPLTLVSPATMMDRVYHTDVVLGEDAAWAYVEGHNANGYYAKTVSFDPVTLVVDTQNTLGASGTQRSDLRIRSALAGGGIYLSGPSTAFVVGGSSIANGFAAGGNAWSSLTALWTGWATSPAVAVGSAAFEAATVWQQPAGQRGATRSVKTETEMDKKAVEVLRKYNPTSILLNREFAGSLCRRPTGAVFETVPNINFTFTDTVVASTCPSESEWIGRYHTHGRDGNDGMSGVDVQNADAAPGKAWYVATPCGNIDKYIGPNAVVHVRLVEKTETTIRCTP